MPALPDARRRDERREAHAQPVRAGRGVDRLAREELVVGRADRVGGLEAHLDLREAVLGVDLPDVQAVGVEVAQKVGDELVDLQQRVRAVGRPAVRGMRLVVVEPREELHLEPARTVRPAAAAASTWASSAARWSYGQGVPSASTTREGAHASHGWPASCTARSSTGRWRTSPDGVDRPSCAYVIASCVSKTASSGVAPTPRRAVASTVRDGDRARARDAVVVGPDDREAGDAGVGQLAGELRAWWTDLTASGMHVGRRPRPE